MKYIIAFVGLILILLSTYLWVYNKGIKQGVIQYKHSKNMQLTLDCAYRFGLVDGERLGYWEGLVYGKQMCDKQNKKIRHHKGK